ncbi:MAG: hypothetical protein HYW23_02365 [Candidatus Aenigmarchaeota archaeon]|nr:hypothetical protein [Candidatus Aenigmarchaeota archaeon]
MIGTASTTSFTDNPTTGDTTAPGAPSSVTAVALSSGGQINVSWTAPSNSIYAYNVTAVDTGNNVALTNGSSSAVTISPVASYRVFRNTTQLLGSTTTTTYTDSPIAGVYFYNVTTVSDASVLSSTNGSSSTVDSRDVTAPAAASSVTATIVTNNATSRQVQVTWTASTSSDASYYRVYRNNTLLGTSSTTTYTDYPNAGIFVYNITTVDTTGNLATSNGTATAVTLGELVGPTINITSPQSGVNVTSASPTISFTVLDNDGGSGVAVTTIAVNITGFNATRDCTRNNDLNYTCTFSTSGLTDLANSTITISAKDAFNNAATNATRNFGVNTLNGVTATLNTSDTSAIADNTYANGWSFTFNVTLGSTTTNSTNVNATSVKVGNWTQVGGTGTIVTVGNTIMNYTDASGTARTAYISDRYNTTDTIYPLQDLDTTTSAINGTVTIYVKLPTSTTPGTYTTTFTFGSYNVSLSTGGNPS